MSTASSFRPRSIDVIPRNMDPRKFKLPPTNTMLDMFIVLEALKAMPFFSKMDAESQASNLTFLLFFLSTLNAMPLFLFNT
jgi:hypothetical protein